MSPDASSSSSSSSAAGVAKYISKHPSFRDPRSHASPLPALYADLSRQRKSNPAGYRASIEWWKDTLIDVTWQGVQLDRDPPALDPSSLDSLDDDVASASSSAPLPDRTVFRLDESTKARWTVEGVGRPLGLGSVLAELERANTVTPLSKFLHSSKPLHGPAKQASGLRGYLPTPGGVASALLVTPARWAASSVLGMVTGSAADDDYSEDERLFRDKRGDWVVYDLVHRIASAFLMHHFEHDATLSPISALMTTAEFRQRLARVCASQFGFHPSERDVQLVLTHLSRDCGGVLTTSGGIIKLAASEDEVAERISEEDRGVVAVKETVRKVEMQISSLEAQMGRRTAQAKEALRKGNKAQAASYVRSRRALEEVLTKRMGARETMTRVLIGIEQAKSDVEIVRAYQTSNEVMHKLLAQPELNIDNVDRTVEALEQSLASQREVDDAIRTTAPSDVDEDEIQQELQQLLDEKNAKSKDEAPPKEDAKTPVTQEPQLAAKPQDTTDDDLIARFNQLRLPPTTDPAQSTPTTPTPDRSEAISQ
ncbi:snf7-domain-containing protein [Moesziomyces antarcticus]|uniref:Snf7-domain-containing protein n=2 Tax=Pseudozyma antarctica TaxID=84753 RepID=A0A081CFE6_PSEA2|nr:snf7-domain-containing protein [Moesziomyces antarcticus]GAK65392.1 snf7-domain-containing protein [Moesziomyces antarcticus]SPO46399.1 uncharacterized protein PSANT_04085 [Moesziomyces antarcticus]